MSVALFQPGGSPTIEDVDELTPRERWAMEINAAEKEVENFHKRAVIANERFIDERDSLNAEMKWFNIYYANTNILESALYSQLPKPCVSRRYADYKDNVARVAALILERSLQQDINDPSDGFDTTMKQCVQDRLIPGLATAWLRLETETEVIPTTEGGSITDNAQSTQPHAALSPDGPEQDGFPVQGIDHMDPPNPADPEQLPQPVPLVRIKEQRVATDYVYWKDFLWSPCRTWEERRWTARKVYMTRKQLRKRFGKDKAHLTSLDFSVLNRDRTGTDQRPTREIFQKAVVWEIWDREERKVHWFAPGYPVNLLDTQDDFLKLQSFEPCPAPMFANVTTTNTVPRPDYYMIQDQYTELNAVNARISLLVQACKVVGVYDQAAKGVQSIFAGNENTMIPVPDWGQFSEKGGMKGSVDWIPLDQIVAAMQRLYEAREAIKGQIYELTGIADIVRGASKASETLGAQKIKAQFASIRIQKLQSEVARFASDILRIKAEISVKHYTPDTLIRRSGIVFTQNDEWVPEAIALLKSEPGFKWRVEVQSDSMAQADYAQDKQERTEFMSMATGFLAQALPMGGQVPELKPVLLGLLRWGLASFKGADDITGMIDKQLSLLENKPPQPPPPDPAMITAQAKIKAIEMKGQQDQQKQQGDMAAKQQDAQMEQTKQQQDLAFKQQEFELDRRMKELELMFKQRELDMKMKEHQVSLQAHVAESQLDMQSRQQEAAASVAESMDQREMAREMHEQGLAQSEAASKAKIQQTKAQAAAKPKE